MTMHRLTHRSLKWMANGLLVFAALAAATAASAQTYPGAPTPQNPAAAQGANPADGPVDEPGRAVARLGILNGDASIKRGDSTEWVAAAVNAPLMSGDQLSVAAGGRVELQLDAAHFLRVAGDSEIRFADLENGHFQVQISHGMVSWRVLRESTAQPEIDTPLVAVHPERESLVRVEVSPDGTTHITVRHGEATVSTQKGSEKVAEGTTMDIRGSMNDPEFQVVAAAARDEWDNWSDQRDSYLARAQAPRYVPQGVSGVEDLDPYGHWVYDPAYGWVWMPTVASTWAPYRDGQWVWEDYYGWTWVDYAPWGWAPFHYGSWYMRPGLGWAWFPGPRVGRVWWRPAMVGFFGWGGGIGFGVGFGFGNVGWIPLAPFEAFRPWYGRGGFGGGALINVNIVRNTNVLGAYRNAGVANGVTAVTAADFQRGNFRSPVAVDRATLQQASVVHGAVPVTPTGSNLRFSNRAATPATRAGAGPVSTPRFFGSSPANSAGRTPFAQQQASVRSALTARGTAVSEGRMASQPSASPAAQQNSAPGWQRFQGQSGASHSATPNTRGASPAAGNAAPGYERYSGTPNSVQQSRPQGTAGYSTGPSAQPRQYQVSPSIVRPRAEPAPAAPQYAPPARSQAAPAPSRGSGYGGGSAGRSAPAGGNGGGGSHGSGRR